MIHELSIENLGVIDSARLPLGAGLTCVTGETGAGKTMILAGLGLIVGAKADAQAVRTGADEARAEAVVDVPAGEAAALVADAGAMVDADGTVVVARSVGAASRARALLGGRTVPQALLAALATHIVTVHGQADQLRLRSAARQRDTLDAYAGSAHRQMVARYRDAWSEWLQAKVDLAEIEATQSDRRAEAAHWRVELEAIDAVDPQPHEDTALAEAIARLEGGMAARTSLAAALEALDGDSEATAIVALEASRRAIADAARHDPSLAVASARLESLRHEAADVARDLAIALGGSDADPAKLDALHERRSRVAALCRRLGTDLDGVLEVAIRARAVVNADSDRDSIVAAARTRERAANDTVADLAAHVSAGRRSAATELADAITGELAQLAMRDASVRVEVLPTEPGPFGADAVSLLMSGHAGAPHRPIGDAASGGELSRIMLAIEVALAYRLVSGTPTLVFDEVDAGVGGKAALAVGRRLAILAETHQVIVVTHLAQVAAHAGRHIVVEKSTDGSVTMAQVREVTGNERVREIARLMSGKADSATARAHALELLSAATVAP